MMIIFILCCYSMASIIVEQKVFEEPRNWLKSCAAEKENWFLRKICALLHCMWCTGVWCGFILCWMGLNVFELSKWDFFFSGMLSGFTTYVISIGMQLLDQYCEKKGIST